MQAVIDAQIIAAEVQNSTFSIQHLSSSVEFGITGYYDVGQLWHAGSQNTFVALGDHNPLITL